LAKILLIYKRCLRPGREPLIDLSTVKQANFISGMLQQQGKEKEKFICITEKNIPGECKPKQLSAAFRKESRYQPASPEN